MPPSLSPEPTLGYINDLDFFKDFENEFSTIAYNDLKPKSDPLIEPAVVIPFIRRIHLPYTSYLHKTTIRHMAPLPHRDLRHSWLRYQVEGYDEDRLSMVYTRDDGESLFTSHAWRRLFEVRGLLVREFILEFLSTCRMSDTEMGLDVFDTLCFQLGGARRRMPLRQFILVLGLHSEEEMADAGFGAYWSGSEKRTRGEEGRKSGARLYGGHFIGRLATHFGLASDEGLRGLSIIAQELPGPERQQAAAAGVPGADEDAPIANERAQAVPIPVQAPQLSPPPPQHLTIS
nr:hypothetical protein [Tanacetum cinerariifolium]